MILAQQFGNLQFKARTFDLEILQGFRARQFQEEACSPQPGNSTQTNSLSDSIEIQVQFSPNSSLIQSEFRASSKSVTHSNNSTLGFALLFNNFLKEISINNPSPRYLNELKIQLRFINLVVEFEIYLQVALLS